MDNLVIPRRTSVSVSVPLSELGSNGEVTLKESYVDGYTCIDCAFSSNLFDRMDRHQSEFKHSIGVRIKRWWNGVLWGRRAKVEMGEVRMERVE